MPVTVVRRSIALYNSIISAPSAAMGDRSAQHSTCLFPFFAPRSPLNFNILMTSLDDADHDVGKCHENSCCQPHMSYNLSHTVLDYAGRPALPNIAAYGATKAAVINFFSSLQMEQMKEGEMFPSITIGYLGAIETAEARWATQ